MSMLVFLFCYILNIELGRIGVIYFQYVCCYLYISKLPGKLSQIEFTSVFLRDNLFHEVKFEKLRIKLRRYQLSLVSLIDYLNFVIVIVKQISKRTLRSRFYTYTNNDHYDRLCAFKFNDLIFFFFCLRLINFQSRFKFQRVHPKRKVEET